MYNTEEKCWLIYIDPSTKENWLEIHKTPRDAWTKELETAITKSAAKQSNNAEQVLPKAPSPTEHAVRTTFVFIYCFFLLEIWIEICMWK